MGRSWRSALAVALAFGATSTLSVAAAPYAAATGYDGFCTDANGVTVVIDFQQLGGGVVVRCAPSVPAGSTGLGALQQAGVPYDGVARWGDAFICRLFNKPSANASLPVKGHAGYHEACIDTPPAAAYWSYWWAPNGGSWTYSQFGVKNRSAIKGGFEGWSFSLNATASSNPRPRIAPVRPATKTPPKKPTNAPSRPGTAPQRSGPPRQQPAAPRPTSRSERATTHGRSDGAGSPAPGINGDRSHTAATERSDGHPSAGRSSVPPSLAAREPASAAATASRAASAPQTAADHAVNAQNNALIADSDGLKRQVDQERSSSVNLPTVIGAGVIAFFVVAGAGAAIRRRSR